MKCKDFQKRIDLELSGSSLDIDSEIKSHIDSCEKCRLYYKEVVKLKEILNDQTFEVLPGELDDITFEKIAKSPRRETAKTGILESIFSLRWAWVPAAVAAIMVMFVVLPNVNNIDDSRIVDREFEFNIDPYIETYDFLKWNDDVVIESEEEGTAIVSLLLSDNSDLETLADELILSSEIDDLIETLTDDEFEILYERLQNINGSS